MFQRPQSHTWRHLASGSFCPWNFLLQRFELLSLMDQPLVLTKAPTESDWSCLKRGSITRRNKASEKMDPCITPRPRAKEGDTCWPKHTELLHFVYQLHSKRHVLEFMPVSKSLFRRMGNSTESNTYCRSYTFLPSWRYLLITSWVANIISAQGTHWCGACANISQTGNYHPHLQRWRQRSSCKQLQGYHS